MDIKEIKELISEAAFIESEINFDEELAEVLKIDKESIPNVVNLVANIFEYLKLRPHFINEVNKIQFAPTWISYEVRKPIMGQKVLLNTNKYAVPPIVSAYYVVDPDTDEDYWEIPEQIGVEKPFSLWCIDTDWWCAKDYIFASSTMKVPSLD